MIESSNAFLVKAREALAGPESEHANERFNNRANRAYYACFSAASHALPRSDFNRQGADQRMSSSRVSSLVNWRVGARYYSGELREVLAITLQLRQTADYTRGWISQRAASRGTADDTQSC
jgi:uncharacterized protein (UPF0332 family)